MSTELQTTNSGELALAPEPTEIMNVIARVVRDPTIDVVKMQALLEMQRTLMADNARREFDAALARIQAKMPRITKGGMIEMNFRNGGGQKTPYVRLEDIDRAIRPLLAEEGFSISFDTQESGQRLIVHGELRHRLGHSVAKQIPLAIDTSGSKNPTQALGSTTSYGKRYLMGMFFNIVADGEDDDGNGGGHEFISDEQSQHLGRLMTAAKVDVNKFLAHFGIEQTGDLPRRRYQEAEMMLKMKLAKQGAPK